VHAITGMLRFKILAGANVTLYWLQLCTLYTNSLLHLGHTSMSGGFHSSLSLICPLDLLVPVVEMSAWDKSGIEKVKLWLIVSQNKSLEEFLKAA